MIPTEVRARRLFVCRGCPHWSKKTCALGAGPDVPGACPAGKFEAVTVPEPSRAHQVALRLANAFREAGAWVGAGAPVAGPPEASTRLDTCRACPRYRDGWCEICGCYMPVKVRLATARCPDVPARW